MKTVELSEEQIQDLNELINMNWNKTFQEILYALESAQISLCMNPQAIDPVYNPNLDLGCARCKRRPEANNGYRGRTWFKPEIVKAGIGYDIYCMDFIKKEHQ